MDIFDEALAIGHAGAATARTVTHKVGDEEWNTVYAALAPWFSGTADWIAKGRRAAATNAVVAALRNDIAKAQSE